MHSTDDKLSAFRRIIEVLDTLRERCPWDAKQTNESLRPNTVEEVFELADALIADDTQNIKKELGDVLLHVLFYSKIVVAPLLFQLYLLPVFSHFVGGIHLHVAVDVGMTED